MDTQAQSVAEAYRRYTAAAEAAGVSVRMADPRDLSSIIGLFERTWGVGRSPDRAMLLALDYAGNTVLLATERGKPVGATLGFLGWTGGLHLHSHMAAVVPWHRGGGVGFALKLFQRALCLDHGITEMRWTFDPLIRRNAHFNLVKLGAEVTDFLPDFYGRLDDVISGGDRSDRFEVRWRLDSERVRRALSGRAPPVWNSESGWPLDVDFEHLRADDPAGAARRRNASRVVFAAALAHGLRPEVTPGNDYVFTADPSDTEPTQPNAANAAHPDTVHPNAAHPNPVHPNTAHPDIAHRDTAHPDTAHPDTAHPDTAHPDIAHPTTAHPGHAQPDTV